MDYKYIEQLLERYWEGETSTEEEGILKAFYRQQNLPPHLARYQSLFAYADREKEQTLDSSFDARLLQAAGIANEPGSTATKHVTPGKFTIAHRLRPLYRAAAAVAIVTLLGTAAQHSFRSADDKNPAASWDYNQQAYTDSYDDPQKAYEMASKALLLFKEGPSTAAADTLRAAADKDSHTEKAHE